MHAPEDLDITPRPPRRALASDTFCACGYNLRGLTPGGRCPECGAGGIDLPGYFVWEADPDWVQLMRAGMALLLVYFFALVVAVPAHIMLGVADSPLRNLVWIAPAAVLVPAVWCLSYGERLRAPGTDPGIAGRMRLMAVAGFVATGYYWSVDAWSGGRPGVIAGQLRNLADALDFATWVGWTYYVCRVLDLLARRFNERPVAILIWATWGAHVFSGLITKGRELLYWQLVVPGGRGGTGRWEALYDHTRHAAETATGLRGCMVVATFLIVLIFWVGLNMAIRQSAFVRAGDRRWACVAAQKPKLT